MSKIAGKCFLFFLITILYSVRGDTLEQVVILGRHNIRAPLSSNLAPITPKEWPKWTGDAAFLTTKGALLEEILGEHIADWLIEENLFTKDCPSDGSVLVYANAPQRTYETAKHFIRSAFKQCNISIYYMKNVTMDPMFNPIISNNSQAFLNKSFTEMQEKLDTINVKDVYAKLNKILDIKNSQRCKVSGLCDLTKAKDTIILRYDEEPNVDGPLRLTNEVVDAFLMAYYDGMDLKKIGWGEIEPKDWDLLTKITKENQNVRFNSSSIARHVSRILLTKIRDEFLQKKHKFTLLVGHDSNLISILNSLGVKPFEIKGQHELTPIGSKIVFEKWHNKELNRDFIKIRMLYLTFEQIRDFSKISRSNPLSSQTFKLKDLEFEIKKDGYYSFESFMDLLLDRTQDNNCLT